MGFLSTTPRGWWPQRCRYGKNSTMISQMISTSRWRYIVDVQKAVLPLNGTKLQYTHATINLPHRHHQAGLITKAFGKRRRLQCPIKAVKNQSMYGCDERSVLPCRSPWPAGSSGRVGGWGQPMGRLSPTALGIPPPPSSESTPESALELARASIGDYRKCSRLRGL